MYIKSNNKDYKTQSDNHNYCTKNSKNINVDYIRLDKCRTSVNYFAPVFFNKLPDSMARLPASQFSRTVKSYLVKKTFYSIDKFLSM